MRETHRGFTLIELMVVVAVAAIMASLAAPSFRSFIIGQRVKTAANDFAMAATLARSEAIKRNGNVSMTAAASGAGGWQSGWTITSAAGDVLSRQSAYSDVVFAGPTAAIVYQANGRFAAVPAVTTISGADGSIRCVSFELSGMPKTRKISAGTCS